MHFVQPGSLGDCLGGATPTSSSSVQSRARSYLAAAAAMDSPPSAPRSPQDLEEALSSARSDTAKAKTKLSNAVRYVCVRERRPWARGAPAPAHLPVVRCRL